MKASDEFDKLDEVQIYPLAFKKEDYFQLLLILSYYLQLKEEDETVEPNTIAFLSDLVKVMAEGLKDLEDGGELPLEIVSLTLFYNSLCCAVHMFDCENGRDAVRFVLSKSKNPVTAEKVQWVIDDTKSIAHHYINDIDTRYGHLPEVAALRKENEATWSWLQKN